LLKERENKGENKKAIPSLGLLSLASPAPSPNREGKKRATRRRKREGPGKEKGRVKKPKVSDS